MKKFQASGAIGLLLTLLVISVIFISVMPSLTGDGTGGGFFMNRETLDTKSVETQVNQRVEEIEKMRKNSLKELNNVDRDF